MGNRYIEKLCNNCNKETLHRVTRKFGHKGRGSSYHLRRTTTTCQSCQFRDVDNERRKRWKNKKQKGLISFRKK